MYYTITVMLPKICEIIMTKMRFKLWVARMVEIYHLRVLRIQTQRVTNSKGDVVFLGVMEKTDKPKTWVIKKIFYQNNPNGHILSVGDKVAMDFELPVNSTFKA